MLNGHLWKVDECMIADVNALSGQGRKGFGKGWLDSLAMGNDDMKGSSSL